MKFFPSPSFFRGFAILATLSALGFSPRALGQAKNPDTEKWSGACAIEFLGKSTLHDFKGKVNAAPFTLTVTNPDARGDAVLDAVIAVTASKMDTDDEKRDAKMRECLEVESHPKISVALSGLKIASTRAEWEGRLPKPSVIPFKLTTLGKTQRLDGTVESWSKKGETVTLVVTFPVSLKASGITVPTVLGFIKVKDTIQVRATITLKPGA
ncbi:MAG: YceI family protein [Verrucomicrobiae bacterium]|nr:YceI family protein [Verrucomicrobiae bacterium]MCP5539673.1 YceI family protein [Akkermansiaceae bacterium]MCP5549412.1 YceI family protein [Akkermansiaceae bacterium]